MSIFPAPTLLRRTSSDAWIGDTWIGATFGPTLKRLREQAGVKQAPLAEAADFDHSYVSRLESGARMPTRDAVNRLADALGLLTQQRDELLLAAGFSPRRQDATMEPIAFEFSALLNDEAVSEFDKTTIRRAVALLIQAVRHGA